MTIPRLTTTRARVSALAKALAISVTAAMPLWATAQRVQQPLGRGVVAVYGRSNGQS